MPTDGPFVCTYLKSMKGKFLPKMPVSGRKAETIFRAGSVKAVVGFDWPISAGSRSRYWSIDFHEEEVDGRCIRARRPGGPSGRRAVGRSPQKTSKRGVHDGKGHECHQYAQDDIIGMPAPTRPGAQGLPNTTRIHATPEKTGTPPPGHPRPPRSMSGNAPAAMIAAVNPPRHIIRR